MDASVKKEVQAQDAQFEDDDQNITGVDETELIDEAKKRFKIAEDYQSDNRSLFRAQLNFIAGDQWDDRLKRIRESSGRPCLTMDRLTTCVNQVVNNQRQNKPAIKAHPISGDAAVETAKIYDGLIRHIEKTSNADLAYETASYTQVAAGIGYIRVLTKYHDETAFEQELTIARVADPMTVWEISMEPDGSDMDWCFIATMVDKKDLDEDIDETTWIGTDNYGWWTESQVRIAEYFRIVKKPSVIYALADGTSTDKAKYEQRKADGADVPAILKKRKGTYREVQWFKIAGSNIIESRVLGGSWIPVIKVIGNEIAREGKIRYTGITWSAMDAQRAYNYHNSVVTETLALQPKAPYIGAKGQFKGVESRWANANTNNPGYLEYEPVTIDGNLVGAPERQAPPTSPTGALAALQLAADDIRWITGMQQATFGAPSNEQSGAAINARTHQSDTATYHYLDNLARAIRHTGRILVDMIPSVYDTARVLRVLGEDGEVDYAEHDPAAPKAMQKVSVPAKDDTPSVGKPSADGYMDTPQQIKTIYNLGVGRYDVEVAVGPSFSTKRLEAVDAMTALLQTSPDLWKVVGDVYLRNQDWPGSQQMADRISRTISPEIKGDEDDPDSPEGKLAKVNTAAGQMHQALSEIVPRYQQGQQMLQQLQSELADAQKKLGDKGDEQALKEYIAESTAKINAFNAETDRLKIVAPAMDPQAVAAIVQQSVREMMTALPITDDNSFLVPLNDMQQNAPQVQDAQPQMPPDMPPNMAPSQMGGHPLAPPPAMNGAPPAGMPPPDMGTPPDQSPPPAQ